MELLSEIKRTKEVYKISFNEFLKGKWLSRIEELQRNNPQLILDVDYSKGNLSIQIVQLKK